MLVNSEITEPLGAIYPVLALFYQLGRAIAMWLGRLCCCQTCSAAQPRLCLRPPRFVTHFSWTLTVEEEPGTGKAVNYKNKIEIQFEV